MDLGGAFSALLLVAAMLLFCIGAGLPEWSVTELAVDADAAAIATAGATVPEFDCTVGTGLFNYNHLRGECGDFEKIKQSDPPVVMPPEMVENVKSLFETFTTTSYTCEIMDPLNKEFVPRPGQATAPTPDPTPVPQPTPAPIIPTPAPAQPTERDIQTAALACHLTRSVQALAMMATLTSLFALLAGLGNMAGKEAARKPAVLLAFLACVFGVATVQYYEKSGAAAMINGLNGVSNFDNMAENLFAIPRIRAVRTNPFGPAYGSMVAGAGVSAFAALLMLLGGQGGGTSGASV